MAQLFIRKDDGDVVVIEVQVQGTGVVVNSWEQYADEPKKAE